MSNYLSKTGVMMAVLMAAAGCVLHDRNVTPRHHAADSVDAVATRIEYPDATSAAPSETSEALPPMEFDAPPNFWELSLQEAIQLSLARSEVLRDLGGLVLDSPSNSTTIFDPAIQETDPRFGVDAALAEFDASFAARAFFENNDRALNNQLEEGTFLFTQDLGLYNFELSKRTAAGTDLFLRNVIDYNFNNSPFNQVPNLPWTEKLEFELRQPILRGAGVNFNRIAGRSGIPGFYNGVLIARINTDITLAEFETSVRDLVSNVENAYWELYFAYRDLDSRIEARKQALETWRAIEALSRTGQRGGEAAEEAQAREQFFRVDAEVQNALLGRVPEKTSSNNFRGIGGVHATERRLRLAVGLPASDGRLIRPADKPPMAKISFDWDEIVAEMRDRRAELRRQRWQIKRREMELLAARNFLMPQLDAVGRYRFRGLGHDLIHSESDGRPRFDNAFMDLTTGDFQEWQLGLDFTVPIGNRRAHAAVRSAQLQLAREKAILEEQERQILNDLSGSITEMRRAYLLANTNRSRSLAALDQLKALEAVLVDPDRKELIRLLDLLLDAQRRRADAESNYHRSLAEYAVAVKNVHYDKGSLLDFNQIYLAEGPWPTKAYRDAAHRIQSRTHLSPGKLIQSRPPIVSRGVYPQNLEPAKFFVDRLPSP